MKTSGDSLNFRDGCLIFTRPRLKFRRRSRKIILVRKNPGSIAIKAPTGADGSFRFTGLAPGTYDLSIASQPPQSVNVGPNGTLGGKLMSGEEPGIRDQAAGGVLTSYPPVSIIAQGANGKALPYAKVQIQDASGETIATVKADKKGCVSWTPTQPGSYKVLIALIK